jgi:hypothetical protein
MLVLRTRPGMTNAAFRQAAGKFMAAFRYRRRGLGLEYFRIFEWRDGVQHAHLLLRVEELSREEVRESAEVAGLCHTLSPVRNVPGIARYIVKHTTRAEKKAELAAPDFRGKLYCVTRNFLTRPFKELRKKLWNDAKQRSK